MSVIIGLTGPTGSGKSSASKEAEKLGFKIVDCDALARVATQNGSAGLLALTKAFGGDILKEDGSLDRKKLAEKAFDSPENTRLLNETILPFIVEMIKHQAVGERVLLDAPTLFESGINSVCTATVAVLADRDVRLERIIKRDCIDKKAALLRISAGKDDVFYRRNADYIIYNNGEMDLFIKEFKKIITDILGKI